jgi:hypothetical protein
MSNRVSTSSRMAAAGLVTTVSGDPTTVRGKCRVPEAQVATALAQPMPG